jgi:hypothetical protein
MHQGTERELSKQGHSYRPNIEVFHSTVRSEPSVCKPKVEARHRIDEEMSLSRTDMGTVYKYSANMDTTRQYFMRKI